MWHFMLKCVFIVGFTRFFASLSDTTMWKWMHILPCCQRQKMFANCSFWRHKVYADIPQRQRLWVSYCRVFLPLILKWIIFSSGLRQVTQPVCVPVSLSTIFARANVFAYFIGFNSVNYWKLFQKLLDDSVNYFIVNMLAFWQCSQSAVVRSTQNTAV